jgi:NAD-dependent deacetylase
VATLDAIEPNEGHRFFTWLEKEMGKSVTVITQNVDDLERKAGLKNVIQMHGNILECICPTCQKAYPLHKVLKKNLVPKCACQAILRPNTVFFGDQVHDFTEAEEVVKSVDLLLIVGTSLEVYPFNLLPYSKNGAPAVLLNKTSNNFHSFDYTLIGEISMICRKLKEKLGASLS